MPIYQTTSFVFQDSAHAADLLALRQVGFIYTRMWSTRSPISAGKLCSHLANILDAKTLS